MPLPDWLLVSGDAVIVTVHAQPGAKSPGVAGAHGDALKIRVSAPPVDGKANRAIAESLARSLGVPSSHVSLLSGETSRRKRFRLEGVDPARVVELLR